MQRFFLAYVKESFSLSISLFLSGSLLSKSIASLNHKYSHVLETFIFYAHAAIKINEI